MGGITATHLNGPGDPKVSLPFPGPRIHSESNARHAKTDASTELPAWPRKRAKSGRARPKSRETRPVTASSWPTRSKHFTTRKQVLSKSESIHPYTEGSGPLRDSPGFFKKVVFLTLLISSDNRFKSFLRTTITLILTLTVKKPLASIIKIQFSISIFQKFLKSKHKISDTFFPQQTFWE